MLSLSSAAIIEKNKLSTNTNWIILLEIALTTGETIRVCRNNDDITWDDETWIAFPFQMDDLSEQSANEVPQISIMVGNQTKAMQTYIENADGGIGAEVTIRVIYKYKDEDPTDDAEIEMSFTCTGCTATSEWVTFTLGTGNPFRKRYPKHRVFKNICRWKFKSDQCGYTGTSYTTCNKTLSDCRARKKLISFRWLSFSGHECTLC